MKLKAPQLAAHLKRQGLAPLYLLSGDEPLQAMECADLLRAQSRAQGYSERVVFSVEAGAFNWALLSTEANSLSLFASKRLLEVRLGDKLPADNDGKQFNHSKNLLAYLQAPPADTLLLLIGGRLDSKTQQQQWFKALDQSGVVVQYEVPEPRQMPAWVQARLTAVGLQASPEAVDLLAERAEGHLLAAAQEIEKLRLLYPGQSIGLEQMWEAVADNARFGVFAWLDAVLGGDTALLCRQLQRLREEGVEVMQILGLLGRELRSLAQIAHALHGGQAQAQVFTKFRVWQNRKTLVNQALQRHKRGQWLRFLRQASLIERMVKGSAEGDPWDELLRLAVRVGGVDLKL